MDNNNVGYKKNRPIILLIALAGMTAYLLPYFRYYYYDAYLAYFGINDMQMGILDKSVRCADSCRLLSRRMGC